MHQKTKQRRCLEFQIELRVWNSLLFNNVHGTRACFLHYSDNQYHPAAIIDMSKWLNARKVWGKQLLLALSLKAPWADMKLIQTTSIGVTMTYWLEASFSRLTWTSWSFVENLPTDPQPPVSLNRPVAATHMFFYMAKTCTCLDCEY